MATEKYVRKPDGTWVLFRPEKLTARIERLTFGLDKTIDPRAITSKVTEYLFSGIKIGELLKRTAQIAASMKPLHAHYGIVAGRIAVSKLHKETKKDFSAVIVDIHDADKTDDDVIMDRRAYSMVRNNSGLFDSALVHDRDYMFDYYDLKALEGSLLRKKDGKVAERPQHAFMRLAVTIHSNDCDAAIKFYESLSKEGSLHAVTQALITLAKKDNEAPVHELSLGCFDDDESDSDF